MFYFRVFFFIWKGKQIRISINLIPVTDIFSATQELKIADAAKESISTSWHDLISSYWEDS